MPKLILSGSFCDDLEWAPASIVDDPDILKKCASSKVVDEWGDVSPRKNASLIHLIGLGAHEVTGPNRNGDTFRADFLKVAHPTFIKHGALYRDHKNKDYSKREGDILKTAFNDDMGRVELLVSANHDKCSDWLSEIEKGKRVDFSMGFDCEFDLCSICGNKAPTRKHYCFLSGTEITMADGSSKPIEQIVVGDEVLDANGLSTKVTHLLPSEIDEHILEIKTSIRREPLMVTGNHPILALPGELGRCYDLDNEMYGTKINSSPLCSTYGFESFLPSTDYVDAANLRCRDFVFSPIIKADPSLWDGFCDEEGAWIFGLFVAEGSFAKNRDKTRISLQFSVHQDEKDYILSRCSDFFQRKYGRSMKVYGAAKSKGCSIRVHSVEAALDFFNVCGEYADSKKVDRRFLHAPDSIKEAFLSGLFYGDGHTYNENDGQEKLRYSRLNSASRDLIRQVWQMTSQLGHFGYSGPYIQIGGPTNRTNKTNSWYLTTSFLGDRGACRRGRGQLSGRIGGYIKDISHVPYRGRVYNFETESHSYVADGIAVHNCKHVKKASPGSEFGMGKILPDGRKCFVFNPSGVFNDMSKVGTGADMIAQHLRKVANLGEDQDDIIGGAELMEAMFPDVNGSRLQSKKAIAEKLSAMEKIIPVSTIKSDASPIQEETANKLRQMPAGTMFGELAKIGCLLPLRDFFSLVMGHKFADIEPFVNEAEKVAHLTFSHVVSNDNTLVSVCENGAFECEKVASSRLNTDEATNLFCMFGMDYDLVEERMIKQAMCGSRRIEPLALSQVSLPALKLLEEFAAYKIAAIESGLVDHGEDMIRLAATIH